MNVRKYKKKNSSCKVLIFDGIWTLYNLHTEKKHQNFGGATDLIKMIMNEFNKSEETVLIARTIENNIPHHIFKKLGWSVIATNYKQHTIQAYEQRR